MSTISFFLKKSLENYQMIAQISFKSQILIAIWKDQMHYSAMENTVC